MADTSGPRVTQRVPDEILLTLTAAQRRPIYALSIPAAIIVIFMGVNFFTLMSVGFAVLGMFRVWSISVSLKGDTLTSRDIFFRRRLKRSEITRVGEERHGAVRRAYVTTRTALYYLPAPIDGRLARNARFEEHLQIVEDWWRGRKPRIAQATDPSPDPSPDPSAG